MQCQKPNVGLKDLKSGRVAMLHIATSAAAMTAQVRPVPGKSACTCAHGDILTCSVLAAEKAKQRAKATWRKAPEPLSRALIFAVSLLERRSQNKKRRKLERPCLAANGNACPVRNLARVQGRPPKLWSLAANLEPCG